MIRLQPVFRLVLAAVTLLLSLQSYAVSIPAGGRTGIIQDGTRHVVDGREHPEEHATLTASVASGHFATRNLAGGGSGGSGLPGNLAVIDGTPEIRSGVEPSTLREYKLRNAHIVLAQYQALFPKHWFW